MPPEYFYSEPISIPGLSRHEPNLRTLEPGYDVVVVTTPASEDAPFRVFRNICPHMGAPLERGKLCDGGAAIQCPWHGYQFDTRTGAFRSNPNDAIYSGLHHLYAHFNPACRPALRLQLLPYKVEGDYLFVCRSDHP
jgi:nitrite reductase/ring-hydroxylating ferredoxin subunit